MSSITAIGTPGFIGFARLQGDRVCNLAHLELDEWDCVSFTPVEYSYIGGVENGGVRKNIGYPVQTAPGQTSLLHTRTAVLAPGQTYGVHRLANRNGLALYRILPLTPTEQREIFAA